MTLFEPQSSVSLARQLAAAARELRRRWQIYPRQVATHRMSQRKADEEIAAMAAIVETLRRLVEAERADG
jgi:hypothetical protein